MELQNLRNEIHLAKKAAKQSGDLLINRKSEYNLRLNSNSKDTKSKGNKKHRKGKSQTHKVETMTRKKKKDTKK